MHVCLFTLAAVVSTARVSLAEPAEPGAVLVTGTATGRQQLIALHSVAAALRAIGWQVDEKAYNDKDSAAAAACLRKPGPWVCISPIIRNKQIQRVAVVSVDPKPGKNGSTDTVISERLVLPNLDSPFVAERFCDYCTDDKLDSFAADLTKELIERAVVGSGQTVIAVKSVPSRARVLVDSKLEGLTDIAVSTVPGDHSVTVELDGYRPDTRHVTVKPNTTENVLFTLTPSTDHKIVNIDPDKTKKPPGDKRDQLVKDWKPPGDKRDQLVKDWKHAPRWGLTSKLITAAGATALVTGVVLFALDEDPVTRPDQEASRRYFDSATGGVILGAGGLIAAGIGGYLWWKYSRSSSAPAVVPVTGGAAVGVTHAF